MTANNDQPRPGVADLGLIEINQNAFEAGLEMQMVLFETANRFAQECAAFAARRAQASVGDAAAFASVTSPDELVDVQRSRLKRMMDDYATETGRFVRLTEQAMKDGAEAVRSGDS